jgi:hypothetical protein
VTKILERDDKVVILLPKALKARLRELCEAEGKSYSQIGNDLIKAAIKKAVAKGAIGG